VEALVVALAALVALVLIDAGYWIAMSLARWAPVVTIGVAAAWLAVHSGLGSTEALIAGALAGFLVRHLRRIAEHRYLDDD
jgi:fructose-specific phosphotransferase system IIC component